MGLFFEPFAINSCCLCGTSENLTGEHKIKASVLKKIFGSDKMAIGNLDGSTELRTAQGPKSPQFHFQTRLCGTCNSSLTQPADREFDRFHTNVVKQIEIGADPRTVFDAQRYQLASDEYLNVFRYFAKLMCCHLAESGGPRPVQLSGFAKGESASNKVTLFIDSDPTYSDYATLHGEHQYAAHGGLVVITNPKSKLVEGFHTTLTLGQARYGFTIKFSAIVGLAIKLFHKEFSDKCGAAYLNAKGSPMSPEIRRKLGI